MYHSRNDWVKLFRAAFSRLLIFQARLGQASLGRVCHIFNIKQLSFQETDQKSFAENVDYLATLFKPLAYFKNVVSSIVTTERKLDKKR